MDLGALRSTKPVSRLFGLDRGTAIDRRYIERFLAENSSDIRGRVLEIENDSYVRRFGGANVTHCDVLHAVEGNPKATLVGDLSKVETLPEEAFDCALLTQTLQFIPDPFAAVRGVHHLLRPGGVTLVTLPGISQISRYDMERWGDHWRFTTRSAEMLFRTKFNADAVTVRSYGNVLSSVAFLEGLAAEELSEAELDHQDPEYQLIVTVRCVKR